MENAKFEYRSVIKFLTKEGRTPKGIYERMVAVYGGNGPTYYQVKFWSKQFKWGRESIEDDARSGRPLEATLPETCKMLEQKILQHRRVKVLCSRMNLESRLERSLASFMTNS